MARWFRLYDDTLNDPKILKLSDKTHRVWIGILCVASKNDGALPSFEDMALLLRMKPEKLQPELEKLIAAGLIDHDDNGLRPHNWQGRQYKSDDSSARVLKYRERRKSIGLPCISDYSKHRPALIRRDGECCVYCRSKEKLVVDHMVPIALGGTDDEDNLALACKSCNSGKAGRTPERAGMTVTVASAADALKRYRDNKKTVTVTVTPPETEADTETEKDSVAKATGAPAPVVPIDARTALFRDGLKSLQALTGKPEAGCRTLVGKWLRDAKDDAKAVHNAIRSAEEVRAADPVPWIERVLRQGDDDEIYRGVL